MTQLAHATKAPAPRSDSAKTVAWVYAGILVVMALLQLFAFEDFLPLMASYDLPGGYGTTGLVGCLIVLSEVFAVPFLLRMALSPLMRWVSLACSVLAPLLWAKLAIWGAISGSVLENSGFLGTKVPFHSGGELFLVSSILLALSIWTAWGLWPGKKR